MKRNLHILILVLALAASGLYGCKGKRQAAGVWPLAYALPGQYEATGDSVVNAADQMADAWTDSVKVVIMPGSLCFKMDNNAQSLILNHFLKGGSVVVTNPKSGEWLHLWRTLVARYDSLKAASQLPGGCTVEAVNGLENMRAQMGDVEGLDGTEPGMGFETPIARLIGFRGTDLYYQVVSLDTAKLLKWEKGTPATDQTLMEKF